jgi:hypothetical protein
MTNRMAFKLNAGRELLRAVTGLLAVAGPLVTGLMNTSQIQAQPRAQSQPANAAAFAAASVKPRSPADNRWVFPQFMPGGRFVST